MRITIVGAGLMGRWHAYYARRAGAIVAAVVDANAAAASNLAGRCGQARTFTNLQEALAQVETDAAHICTPLPTHAALAEEALKAGRHVLVEKPLAEDVARTQQLLALAQEHGRMVVPVHQFPFQRGFGSLLGRKAQLGNLVRVEFATCSAGGEGYSPARRAEIAWEILPHPLSLMRRFVQSNLSELSWQVVYAQEDGLTLAATAAGVQLSIMISLSGRPTRNELCVTGSQCSARLDLFHGFCLWDVGSAGRMGKMLRPVRQGAGLLTRAGANLAGRAIRRQPAYPGLPELIGDFYKAVQDNGSWPISADETMDIARCLDVWRRECISCQPQNP